MATPPNPTLIGTTPGRRIPVYIEAGLLDNIGRLVRPARAGLSVVVIIDRAIDRRLGPRLCDSLASVGWKVHHDVLAAGERIKSGRTIAGLHTRWFASGFDRSTTVLAVGGGTITDAVGFAAATFLRGLPLWHLPTTIIGQVDAAIGGKVGINTPHGKNLIGCFYQPTGVVIDPLALLTLPIRERCAGLAEIIKYGVIADPTLFRRCERDVIAWITGRRPISPDVIRRCVRIKLRTVARDEDDRGVRQSLNFGHTLGHAFERVGQFRRLRHGEAVALGMVAAARISQNRHWLAERESRRLARICAFLTLGPPRRETFSISDIIRVLRYDKKRRAGRNVWVLPRTIGKIVYVDDVTTSETRDALVFLRRWLRRLPSDLEET